MSQVPFKVMCIKVANKEVVHMKRVDSPIEVGSEYLVVGVEEDDRAWYVLAGFDPLHWFDSKLFAILPDEPAEVINEQEREAILI